MVVLNALDLRSLMQFGQASRACNRLAWDLAVLERAFLKGHSWDFPGFLRRAARKRISKQVATLARVDPSTFLLDPRMGISRQWQIELCAQMAVHYPQEALTIASKYRILSGHCKFDPHARVVLNIIHMMPMSVDLLVVYCVRAQYHGYLLDFMPEFKALGFDIVAFERDKRMSLIHDLTLAWIRREFVVSERQERFFQLVEDFAAGGGRLTAEQFLAFGYHLVGRILAGPCHEPPVESDTWTVLCTLRKCVWKPLRCLLRVFAFAPELANDSVVLSSLVAIKCVRFSTRETLCSFIALEIESLIPKRWSPVPYSPWRVCQTSGNMYIRVHRRDVLPDSVWKAWQMIGKTGNVQRDTIQMVCRHFGLVFNHAYGFEGAVERIYRLVVELSEPSATDVDEWGVCAPLFSIPAPLEYTRTK